MKYPFLSLLLLIACATPQKQAREDTAPEPQAEARTVSPLLSPVLDAHGGIERWDQFEGLNFKLTYADETAEQFWLDLRSRHERIEGPNYAMGFDGINYWQVLEEGTEPKNPQFMINLQFYFFALPFVLADPGVNISDLGKRSLKGQEYDVIKATFGDGVGVASKDQYLLYLEPESKELRYLLYSVTYFDAGRAERYNAAHYEEWQEVQGLKVPLKMKSYVWDAEKEELGEQRYGKTFSQVKFLDEAPETSLFARPAEAYEE